MPFAEAGPLAIHYDDQGSGPTVALLPGLGLGGAAWEPVAERLRRRGLRTLAIDLRGAGASDAPDEPYDGAELAADVVAVLDHAGIERAAIVGLSLGGAVAQHLVLDAPQRVGALCLVATVACLDAWSRRIMELRVELLERLDMAAQARFGLLTISSPQTLRTHEAVLSALADRLAQLPPERQRAYRRQLDFTLIHDTRSRLADVPAPTLVVAAEHDLLASPLQGRELAALIPGSQYREVAGCSHVLFLEAPEHLAKLIGDFVLEHGPSPSPIATPPGGSRP